MSWKSMSPLNSDELVPPRVNTPPGTFCDCELGSARVSQNDSSCEESWLLFASACQKGVARVLAMLWNARPMMPDTEPSRRPLVSLSTTTIVQ